MTAVLIDTNILLRLLEVRSPEHSITRKAVSAMASRGDSLRLAPQVLQEFWVVATRPTDVMASAGNRSLRAKPSIAFSHVSP